MNAARSVIAFVDPKGRERRMTLRLDLGSHIPPYEQLRAQFAVMIAAGLLEPHTRLPTVRALSGALSVAPGTVARTFRELQHEGLIESRGRHGSFVVDEPPGSEPVAERQRRLELAATTFAHAVRQLGIRPAAALEAAERALHDFDQ